MSNYDWVFWPNVTNIALGVVVVLAVLLVAYGVAWELIVRHREHSGLRPLNEETPETLREEFSHRLAVPELGLTMADGGEHLNPTSQKPGYEKKSP